MDRTPRQGEFYRHFKDKLYQIVGIATHSETREKLVIYQALYGDYQIYARPLEMFVSEVDHEKYPQVTQKYRFEKVEFDAKQPEKIEEVKQETTEEAPVSQEKDALAKKIPARADAMECFMSFLDSNDWEEKYNLLVAMQDGITDHMIDSMAVSMDVVIEDGPIEKRYDDLKYTVRTHQRYEFNNRLR